MVKTTGITLRPVRAGDIPPAHWIQCCFFPDAGLGLCIGGTRFGEVNGLLQDQGAGIKSLSHDYPHHPL